MKPVDESTTLANMFQSNHTAFGTKSYFKFASKRLIIFLLGGPTINLGNLVLDAQRIKSQAAMTIYPENLMESFALGRPDTVKMPEVQMMGPSSVGKCRILMKNLMNLAGSFIKWNCIFVVVVVSRKNVQVIFQMW